MEIICESRKEKNFCEKKKKYINPEVDCKNCGDLKSPTINERLQILVD